jgi:glycosyltransferase involved in cell wall biosynthesis
MKLALVVPGGFGGPDDVIPALSSLTDELALRHDVHVFEFSSPGVQGTTMRGRAHVHLLPSPSIVGLPRLARRPLVLGHLGRQLASQVVRAGSPTPFQVVHAFWANDPGLLGGLLGRALGLPVVLSVGGGEAVWIPEVGYGGAGSAPARMLVRLALWLADQVTVGTTFARSLLDSRTAARARVIPLGIAWRQFDAPPARPPGPPWRLLHVANLNLVKDQNTLLTALGLVVSRLGDVSLDCIGEDALGGRVQTQARGMGLDARVRFHGPLPPDELVQFYRSSHLHVLSSRYESQGVVVLEAAAAGLPTVGTAVGLLPTLSPDAASCVPTGDPSALARSICALLTDETRRQAMGVAAQNFARAHDVVWTARAFEQTYRTKPPGSRLRRRAV